MTALRDVRSVHVSREHVIGTLEAIRAVGAHGHECLVLWLGRVDSEAAVIEEHLVPAQEPIESEDGVGYFVSGATLFELNRYLSRTRLRLIAQIHSHPTEAFHSPADDRYAIVTSEGGFSLVVPDFGNVAADLTAWAAYRLTAGEWRELSDSEVETIFTTTGRSDA